MPREYRTPACRECRRALRHGTVRNQRDEPAIDHLRRSESRTGVGDQSVFRMGGGGLGPRPGESFDFTFSIHARLFMERKKTDVSEHPKAFEHVGLLFNGPPGTAELPFI